MAKRRDAPKSEAGVPPRVAFIDANVFFAPRLRDLMMHLHAAQLINVHWSKSVEAEWTRNVVAKQGADADDIQDCLRGMRDAVDGWEVTGFEKHIPKFPEVDEKDWHVAAAAYKLSLDDWPGQAVALVTKNVQDFPASAFNDTEVVRYSLGTFVDALYEVEPVAVTKVAEGCRRKLKHPPLDRERYVAVLMSHRCIKTAEGLAKTWGVECPKIAKDGTLYYETASKKGTKRKG